MKKEIKIALPFILFLVIFTVYLKTLNPVFHADDSPETVSCSYTLGIQHPPGYPLPTIIGKIFTFIPIGNIGFRVNLMAALWGSLSSILIFLIIINFFYKNSFDEKNIYIAGIIASLSFAFSRTLWSQSLSAKGGIYTFNAFFTTLLIFIAFLFDRTKNKKYFYLFLFIYGLSIGNHWESIAVITPAFIVFFIMIFIKNELYKDFLNIKTITISLFLFFIGIFTYDYLVIRANNNAYLNWGNPVDLKQLLWVITRAEYTASEKARNFEVVYKQINRIVRLLIFEFSFAGILLFFYGIKTSFSSFKKNRVIFLLIMYISILLSLSFYFNLKDELLWIMDVFIIPAYIIMALFIGYGIIYVLQETKRKIFITSLLFIIPFYLLYSNHFYCNQDRYFYAYDFGKNILKSADEDNGITFLEGDFYVLPQMYFKYVEKSTNFCPITTIFLFVDWGLKLLKNECPGVKFTVTDKDPFMDRIKNIISLNFKNRPIYVSLFRKVFNKFYKDIDKYLYPTGLLFKLSFNPIETINRAKVNLKTFSYRNLLVDKLYMDSSTSICVSNYASIYLDVGNKLSQFNKNDEAVYFLKNAVAIANEKLHAESLTHLGIFYAKTKNYKKAARLYEQAIKEKPTLIEAYSNLIGVYNTLKEYDKAIKLGKIAIRINPNFAEVYNNIGIAYYYKGEKKKAFDYIKKAVKINPNNKLAKQNLEELKKELKLK